MLLAASMVAGAMLSGGARARALSQTAPGKMILFGSSSMNGAFGYLIAADFEEAGFDVTRKGVSSAGLARPDFRDLPQMLGGFPIRRKATSVLLYIGGNDGQSLWLRPEERTAQDVKPWVFWKDERWPGIYESRMTQLINSLCERGAEHVFVLPPADVEKEHLQKRLERVRKLQQHAVKATKCGRYIPTMGDHESRFELDGQPLRAPDGVHMNRMGASLVWTRIRERVFTLLGYTPPIQDCERCVSLHPHHHRVHRSQSAQRDQRADAAVQSERSGTQGERRTKPSERRARSSEKSAGAGREGNTSARRNSTNTRDDSTSMRESASDVRVSSASARSGVRDNITAAR